MVSLRAIARCIGLSGRIGVVSDFYGYRTRGAGRLSLVTQMRLLQGKHIHLNLIRTASFSASQQEDIDAGLQFMRNIYATVNVGVGRIQRFAIPPGHEDLESESAVHDLWNEFSVYNDSIDVFLVHDLPSEEGGLSPTPGSCDKDSKNDSGCAVDSIGSIFGLVIAHEVGHFLGLEHEDDLPDNLMFPSAPNGGRLYGGQGGVMVLHCSMNGGCGT